MVTYRTNASAVAQQVAGIRARGQDVGPVLEDLGRRMTNHSIPTTFREGGRPSKWAPAKRGGQTQVDTSALVRSVNSELRGGNTLRVGTNSRYAAQRNFGGPIVAKKGWLAIPLPAAARRRPRSFSNLKWAPPAPGASANIGGYLIQRIAAKGAKKASGRLMFVLMKRVDQPARPFLLFQPDDIVYAERAMVKHLAGSQ